MEENKKAKLLLNDGSYLNYIIEKLNKYNITPIKIKESFDNIFNEAKYNYDEYTIEELWNDNWQEFIENGYTRDDIIYTNIQEYEFDITGDIIIDIALYFIKTYFDDDNDLLDSIMEYIKQCIYN